MHACIHTYMRTYIHTCEDTKTQRYTQRHTHASPCLLRERESTILSHEQQRIAAELSACRASCHSFFAQVFQWLFPGSAWPWPMREYLMFLHVSAVHRAFWYLMFHSESGRPAINKDISTLRHWFFTIEISLAFPPGEVNVSCS